MDELILDEYLSECFSSEDSEDLEEYEGEFEALEND